MKNIKVLKQKSNDFYKKNSFYKPLDKKIIKLIETCDLKKINTVLEIGCSDGYRLNIYKNLLKSKKSYGIDISKKAINHGKKIYKNLNLFNLTSLEIHKLNQNFDLIICGFFLYQLDRELIFEQFNLIYKKLKINGFLIIWDFDPLFKHTNKNHHKKSLNSFKMSYDNFLIESGLFELLYKNKFKGIYNKTNIKYKSNTEALTLFRKINFVKKYPKDL